VGDEGWSGGGSDEDGAVSAPSKRHRDLVCWERSKPAPLNGARAAAAAR